ncbi:hypothetical protein CbuD7D7780_11410 [Coxiella burnetii]|nr:hypothetical protein CbuD7E6568_11380 [Coxiella burnetii]OYK81288.1 hypothetical protein CbuD7D7780_11410 [Coxiella burnetii]
MIPRRRPGALLARCARCALGPRLRGDDDGFLKLRLIEKIT